MVINEKREKLQNSFSEESVLKNRVDETAIRNDLSLSVLSRIKRQAELKNKR
jgi:hypothetical protein